jgi:hypothetical protein
MDDTSASLATLLVGASTVAICCAVAWRRAVARVRRLEDRLLWEERRDQGAAPDLVSAQLEHMAGQIDRLSEGQDFLARVLAERSASHPASLPAPEPRVVTPH